MTVIWFNLICIFKADSKTAMEAVQMIFTKIDSPVTAPPPEELENFINANKACKRTALQIAVEKGHEDVIKLLFARNADTSIQYDQNY